MTRSTSAVGSSLSARLFRERSAFLRVLLLVPVMLLLRLQLVLEVLFGKERPVYSMYGLLLQLMYGGGGVNSILSVSVSMVFVLLFGTEIYRQMGTEGVYFFSRQRSRTGWYVRASIRLLAYTVLWCLLQLGVTLLAALYLAGAEWNREYALFLAIHFAGMALFDFLLVYLVNVMSMCVGSTLAFISVYAGCAASFYLGAVWRMQCVAAAAMGEGMNEYTVGNRRMYLLPTELLQPRWDGAAGTLLHGAFWYRRTVIGMGVTAVLLIFIFMVGLFALRRMDIGLTDKEHLL